MAQELGDCVAGIPQGGRRRPAGADWPMRLEASDLACVRGGREVFSGLGLCRRRRRGAAGHRPQRRGQILPAADDRRAGPDRRRPAGAGRRRPGAHHRRAGPLPRPPGRAEAVADGRREPAVLGPLSRRRRAGAGRRALATRSGSARWPICRPPICRPASGGGCRSPGCWPCKRPIWLLDEPTSALDRDAQDTLAGLMREHLAGGGIIVAATHGPIGLDGATRTAAREQAA